MEAKDTVMDNEDFAQLAKDYPNERGILEVIPVILQAQAEISFPAGEKQGIEKGIREVVEWIDKSKLERNPKLETCLHSLPYFHTNERDWQAKLKEWGIDESIGSL